LCTTIKKRSVTLKVDYYGEFVLLFDVMLGLYLAMNRKVFVVCIGTMAY